jgi:hypothetical protein
MDICAQAISGNGSGCIRPDKVHSQSYFSNKVTQLIFDKVSHLLLQFRLVKIQFYPLIGCSLPRMAS